MRDHFEELIKTIEKNAVDNKATITNVFLWAESWRAERDIDIENELQRIKKKFKETPFQKYSPLQEFLINEKQYGELFEQNELPLKELPLQAFTCSGNNCGLSSTIGEKTSSCERLGCQLNTKV